MQDFHNFYKIHKHKPSIFMAYDSTPNTYLHILTIINAAAAWQKWPFTTLNTIFLGRHLLLYEKPNHPNVLSKRVLYNSWLLECIPTSESLESMKRFCWVRSDTKLRRSYRKVEATAICLYVALSSTSRYIARFCSPAVTFL